MTGNEQVINLNTSNDIKFDRHAVIEASAGTGKTYTLVELVMRLLIDQRLPLEKILLMTFTEQATGELKARIRIRIQEALQQHIGDRQLQAHLEQCLLNINQASVFTIHGFCQGALKEFAFEQGAVFNSELTNDNELRERILKQMKRQWPADTNLLKQLKAFTAEHKIQDIDGMLLELAKQYRPEFDHFYPEMDKLNEQHFFDTLLAINFSEMPLWEKEFKTLKGLKGSSYKSLWQGVIEPFLVELKFLENVNELQPVNDLFRTTFKDKQDVCQVFFFRLPAIYNDSHGKSNSAENRELAPHLFDLIDRLNAMWSFLQLFNQAQKYRAIPQLLRLLFEKCQQYKIDNSLISYDDMITRLWQRLKMEQKLPCNEQLLTQSLRKKYQFAMVDEFQDTDIRQWEIFEHLFLNANEQSQKLLVIGDPKQAIYGFRGADLQTYKQATASILNQYHGQAYRLNVNYRTAKPLIDSLNKFFAKNDSESGGWFESEDVVVKSPEEVNSKDLPQIISGPDELNPINTVVTSNGTADEMKSSLAKQIADTIKHQLIGQVKFRLKGQEQTLNPSDVCVLTRSNSDAEYIEHALRAVEVPYTIHKKKNLYQSIEAIHFHVLLTALARPHELRRVNNALLTLFFALKPEQLTDFAEEKLPQVTALWLQIKEAVANKNWIKAFDLLLHDSGAMFRARNNSRRLTNLRQLKQQLLQTALKRNLEANALLKEFQNWRSNQHQEEDLHQKDTEKPAVKIMTMHISKGLEFPVVFLFGDFIYKDTNKFYSYYDRNKEGMVFDLVKQHKDLFLAQQQQEALQLYYVAMTRAIFMLFLPLIDETEQAVKSPGFYVQTVMQRLKQMDIPSLSDISPSDSEQTTATNGSKNTPPDPLHLPENLTYRRRLLHSFSSLSSQNRQIESVEFNHDFSQNLVSELFHSDEAPDLTDSKQVKMTIPGGVKTGLVLHGIFEHVDFAQILALDDINLVYQHNAIMQVIDEQMQHFKLENRDLRDENGVVYSDYRKQLADWVWHTLKKPLDALDGQCLAAIDTNQRCHELSFFWNQQQTNLTGFIDLLFALPGSNNEGVTDYFILDWKSNLSANGYSPEILATEVMTKHQYNWQYQLYALALQSWFESLNLKNARLKGALYVFSRGMDCLEKQQNGVFYDDFSQKSWQLEDIKRELLSLDQAGGR